MVGARSAKCLSVIWPWGGWLLPNLSKGNETLKGFHSQPPL